MPTYGPFTATAIVTNGTGSPGSIDTYGAVQDDDGPRVTQSSSAANFTLSGFGFSVPLDEVIVGVEVGYRNRRVIGVAPPPPYLPLTGAVFAGVAGTGYTTCEEPDTSFITGSFGGPSDTVGLALTPSLVNDSGFGVVFSAEDPGVIGPLVYEADLVTLTVYTILPAIDDESLEGLDMTTRYLDDVATFWVQLSDSSGAATDATGTPTYAVYEDLTGTAILTGNLAKQTATGLYSAQVTTSTANGFEVGKSYFTRAAATVDGVAQGKPAVGGSFVIRSTIADSVWTATLVADSAGIPTTTGGVLRRLYSKMCNRFLKSGNLVTTYADNNTTALVTQQYSVTDAGFDRSRDV